MSNPLSAKSKMLAQLDKATRILTANGYAEICTVMSDSGGKGTEFGLLFSKDGFDNVSLNHKTLEGILDALPASVEADVIASAKARAVADSLDDQAPSALVLEALRQMGATALAFRRDRIVPAMAVMMVGA